MKKRFALLFTAALALLAFVPGSAVADPNNEAGTYELHMEVPNIAQAPNGDRVAVTGGGVFSVHPKSVSASGSFTHTSSTGTVLGGGTWTATDLLAFDLTGCGVLAFTTPPTPLPPDFCGGLLKMGVLLTTPAGTFDGTLTVFCIIGDQTPASRDDASEEGVTLNIQGVINFNKVVTGMNVYVRTS